METSKQRMIREILSFQTEVDVTSTKPINDLLNELYAEEPRLIVYLDNISLKTIGWSSKLILRYCNKDIDPSDVMLVDTYDDVMSALFQCIGNYKKKFVLIGKSADLIVSAYNKFSEHDTYAYPNFRRAEEWRWGSSYSPLQAVLFDCEYRIGKVKLIMMDMAVLTEVDRITRDLHLAEFPEEVKIYLTHNYLATTIAYYQNEKASNLERSYLQSAYGGLVNKKCVCQGYAEAFKRILNYNHIACDVVCGKVLGSDGYHAWNIVQLSNGKSYHFDVTWDTNSIAPEYDYFAKPDSFFKGKRNWNIKHNLPCPMEGDLLNKAKCYVTANKEKLISYGIARNVID